MVPVKRWLKKRGARKNKSQDAISTISSIEIREAGSSDHDKMLKDTEKQVLFMISVYGNQYCCDPYFSLFADQLLKQYGMITFLIADSLQKYNFTTAPEPNHDKAAIIQAHLLGVNWLAKHASYFIKKLKDFNIAEKEISSLNALLEDIAKSQSPDRKNDIANKMITKFNTLFNCFKLIRWDDWSQDHPEKINAIKQLCNENKKFQADSEKMARDYLERNNKNSNYLFLNAIRFVKEESISIISNSTYHLLYYPGPLPEPFLDVSQIISENKNELHKNFPDSSFMIGEWAITTIYYNDKNNNKTQSPD